MTAHGRSVPPAPGPASSSLGRVSAELRREAARIRQPRRLLAILLLSLAGGVMVALLLPRGELAGADARAYWAGVRIWLAGGDPYHPSPPLMPYPYAPWLLPFFLPWALLPWQVAWFLWRGLNVLLFAWSVQWAYRRHPLATAALVLAFLPWLAATFDTGNITLLLALAVWGAQFVGPRLAGGIWALTVMTKWFPVFLFVFLPPRGRLWGIVALCVAGILSLATLPQTMTWIQAMISFPRPIRVDYALLLWAAVPWIWRNPAALRRFQRDGIRAALSRSRGTLARHWSDWRREPSVAATETRREVGARLRSFLGVP